MIQWFMLYRQCSNFLHFYWIYYILLLYLYWIYYILLILIFYYNIYNIIYIILILFILNSFLILTILMPKIRYMWNNNLFPSFITYFYIYKYSNIYIHIYLVHSICKTNNICFYLLSNRYCNILCLYHSFYILLYLHFNYYLISFNLFIIYKLYKIFL